MEKLLPISGTKNRVVIKTDENENVSKGGIIIPDTAQKKPQRGQVISISDADAEGLIPMVEVGDKVVYHKESGSHVEIGGEEYLIMRESEILSILVGIDQFEKVKKRVNKSIKQFENIEMHRKIQDLLEEIKSSNA